LCGVTVEEKDYALAQIGQVLKGDVTASADLDLEALHSRERQDRPVTY